jgi:hypothetical protein
MMKNKKQWTCILMAIAALTFWTGCGPAGDHATQHDDAAHQHVGETAEHSHGTDGAHTHDGGDAGHHSGVPGPNGGRLVVGVEPHLEFFVQPDRYARITFVNDDIEPIPPVDLSISLVTGDRTDPLEISFTQNENVLLSDVALPEDPDLAIVLQISGGGNEDSVFERFHLDMATCPDCQLHEYACICGHSEHEHDHEH